MVRADYRREAFEEYFGITPTEATAVVFKMLSKTQGLSAADAEDITQETLLTMVQQCGQPGREVINNGRAWARRVAHFRRQDFWRRKGRQPDLTDDMDEASAQGRHSADASNPADDEVLALATRVIEGFSPKLRVVAQMLFDPQDLTFDAVPQKLVADELGLAVGTVKSRLHAIKEHFKRALLPPQAPEVRGEDMDVDDSDLTRPRSLPKVTTPQIQKPTEAGQQDLPAAATESDL